MLQRWSQIITLECKEMSIVKVRILLMVEGTTKEEDKMNTTEEEHHVKNAEERANGRRLYE